MVQYSYNGWEAHPDKKAIGVVQHPVYSGGLKAGDVTTVLEYVDDQMERRVEPRILDDCWGYAYKANANNQSQLSCHASGTAIDRNAPAHPNGKGGTFTAAQVKEIEKILAECGGAVKWLKGYDEMHFDIAVDAKTLAPIAARLAGGKPPAATSPPPAGPTPPTATPTPPKDEDMTPYTEAQMRQFAMDGAQKFAATQEFKDRTMQACIEALGRDAAADLTRAQGGAQKFAATQEFRDRVMQACTESIKRAGLT